MTINKTHQTILQNDEVSNVSVNGMNQSKPSRMSALSKKRPKTANRDSSVNKSTSYNRTQTGNEPGAKSPQR